MTVLMLRKLAVFHLGSIDMAMTDLVEYIGDCLRNSSSSIYIRLLADLTSFVSFVSYSSSSNVVVIVT